MKQKSEKPERDAGEERRRRFLWIAAFAASIALHCLMIVIITPGMVQDALPVPQERLFDVSLVKPEPLHEGPAGGRAEVQAREEKKPAPKVSGKTGAGRGGKVMRQDEFKDTGTAGGPPVPPSNGNIAVPPPAPAAKDVKIDIWPSRDSLSRIAGADPRVPHLMADKEPPLVPERYVKDNLPPKMKPEEIAHRLDGFINPQWDHVKDEGMTGYTTRKFGGMLKDWLTAWQTAVAKAGEGGYDPEKLEGLEVSSTVVTLLEFMPGREGNWTVRIFRPSGYRILDGRILEDAERVALTLPAWPEGFGWVLRFKLETKFTIIPPAPMAGLAFDLSPPFKADLIYPLKKMLKKAICFEGAAKLGGGR